MNLLVCRQPKKGEIVSNSMSLRIIYLNKSLTIFSQTGYLNMSPTMKKHFWTIR